MVGVIMGENHVVDAIQPSISEERGDHHPSDVEGVVEETPAVDQHRCAVRELYQSAQSLADVQDRCLELASGGIMADILPSQGTGGQNDGHASQPQGFGAALPGPA